jgi:hypothetical protein
LQFSENAPVSSKQDLMVMSPGETLKERIADLVAFQAEQRALLATEVERGGGASGVRLQLGEIQAALAELRGQRPTA